MVLSDKSSYGTVMMINQVMIQYTWHRVYCNLTFAYKVFLYDTP